MKESSEWKSNFAKNSTCLSLLWKKLPSQNQTMGSVAIGGGLTCLLIRIIYNCPTFDHAGALLIVLGIIKFREDATPLPRPRKI